MSDGQLFYLDVTKHKSVVLSNLEASDQDGWHGFGEQTRDNSVYSEMATCASCILSVVCKHNPQLRCTVKPEGYRSSVSKFGINTQEHSLERRDVLAFLSEWFKDGKEPYCAVLGELGMGKSTTCVLFAQEMLEEYYNDPTRPLPVYLDLRNLKDKAIANELTIDSIVEQVLLPSFLDEETVMGGVVEEYAKKIVQLVQSEEEGALIIFDGLDEVFVHLSPAAAQQFVRKILALLPVRRVRSGSVSRLLVTCRTHYFRTLREQNNLFTLSDRSAVSSVDFRTIVLHPFGNHQIREYLQRMVPHKEINALIEMIASVHNLMELAERPYTLSLIPALIHQIEAWKMGEVGITGASIYACMVQSWLHRDDTKHKFLIEHKIVLMEYFAAELWRSGKTFWTISMLENWFGRFLQTHSQFRKFYTDAQEGVAFNSIFSALKEDLRAATFVVRVGESAFRFAHTSLLEFFLASSLHKALLSGTLEAWAMPKVSQETLEFLGQLLSQDAIDVQSKAIATLSRAKEKYVLDVSEHVLAYMIMAFHQGYPTPSCEEFCLDGAQLSEWSIAGKIDIKDQPNNRLNFRGASFKGANLSGASLRYLNLTNAMYSEATLVDAELTCCQATGAYFEKANLTGVTLIDVDLANTFFFDAKVGKTEWIRCNLESLQGLDSMPATAVLSLCTPESRQNDQKYDSQLHDRNQHQSVIGSCRFTKDGQRVISASADSTFRIWDIGSGECLQVVVHDKMALDGALSHDSNLIITASGNPFLCVWNAKTGERLSTLFGHTNAVRCCVFFEEERLVSSSDDCTIRVWNTSTGTCLEVFEGHQAPIRSCEVSEDGRFLASASDDKTVRIWDMGTGACLHVLKGHKEWVRKCVFSPDGSTVASASGDKTVRLWDVKTGQCLAVLAGHTGPVRACAISSEGNYLASVSYDGTVKIWDWETREVLRTLHGHEGRVRCCAFSVNGLLVSASDDRTVRLWNSDTGECLRVMGQAVS